MCGAHFGGRIAEQATDLGFPSVPNHPPDEIRDVQPYSANGQESELLIRTAGRTVLDSEDTRFLV